MTGMLANVLLNMLMIGLLIATIGYCYVLNRRIKTLQDSKSDLAALLSRFDESTIKASETIVAMQTASKKIGDNIQMRVEKANYVLEDLTYSIEKGTKLTSQLEAGFAIARAKSRTEHQLAESSAADVLVLDKTVDEHDKPSDHTIKHGSKRSPASIEAIVEKVVSRKPANGTSPSRSRAEQELIELIRGSKG